MMNFIYSKLKILPTILFLITLCFIVKLQDVVRKISDASENKSHVSFKTSFVNEAFASENKAPGKPEEGSATQKPESPKGLTINSDPKSIDKAYRNNAEAAQVGAYSVAELELLQNLAKRKTEMIKSQEELDLKSKLLEANELQLNKKLEELKGLKGQLDDLLAQYNEKENLKIASLVKIYENMKPKDAAKIFEELDMPILLMVVNAMKESKVAPILSAMDPVKAKEISTEFANQKKIRMD